MNTTKKYGAIVIGVSAGGFHALSLLLSELPANYPVPVIVVQHRTKDYPDLLENLLQEKCVIKIKQADEKEKISAGMVYLAPPDYHLLIEADKTFSLSANEYAGYSKPSIDILFETAAEAYARELAGIILTGMNSDGAKGIEAIKLAGGTTIAQIPEEAQYPQMPQAAIDTQKTDYIWTLQQIQQYLINLS